ncbi:MAG: zinc ribbon domain-containing protein, partial [Myxococcaceae bacterium]|nr:zinc ribbon domain-containing protein [Myxococcaceae bacterium]
MHCPACNRERPPDSSFCVVCGSRLVQRTSAEIREQLSRVEWLISEVSRWDSTLVGRADARRLAQFYTQQEDWLRAELAGALVTQVAPGEPVTSLTPDATGALQDSRPRAGEALPQSSPSVEPAPARADGASGAAVAEAASPEPAAVSGVREAAAAAARPAARAGMSTEAGVAEAASPEPAAVSGVREAAAAAARPAA